MLKILPSFSQLQLASRLLAASVLISLLMPSFNLAVLAEPTTPAAAPDQSQQNPVTQKLLGQWQIQNSSSVASLNFIFTPDGKLFVLGANSDSSVAVEFKYSVDPKTQPMSLDVTIPGQQQPVLTIFEFTDDGQLRLQLQGTNPGQPRPKDFSSTASVFKKVSDTTTLPDNVKLINPFADNQASKKPEDEGKQNIGVINRAQQAYYLENHRFAKTLAELDLGIKSDTENYHYQIVHQGTNSVISTATAKKPELKSYTGIAYLVKSEGEDVTAVGICETDQPSTKPPLTPKLTNQKSQPVQCPAGSH